MTDPIYSTGTVGSTIIPQDTNSLGVSNPNALPQSDTYNAANGGAKAGTSPDFSSIDSSHLSGGTSTNFSQPNLPAPFDPSSIAPSKSPYDTQTAPQQQASGLMKELQDLNTSLSGKSQFETDQYKAQGFGTTTDANGNIVAADPGMGDLQTQLETLTNQAKAIPLQAQQQATKGLTTVGGLQPFETAALRNNAIQSLNVASLISARNGALGHAKMLVDIATTQKFGPIEAKLAADTKNLALIQNSPEYTNAEKKQAAQQAQNVQQQQAQLEIQKSNYVNTQNEVLKYASVASAQQMQEMQKATDPTQVAAIANKYQLLTADQKQAAANLIKTGQGRYKDTITTTTDEFGNQNQTVRVFDTITGQFVNGHANSAVLNSQGGYGQTTPASSSPGSTSISGKSTSGLSFDQYGLLANTDFNPKSTVDQLAQKYLASYLQNGNVPTASTLGRGIKPGAMAQVDQRARDLFFKATGLPMPNPKELANQQSIINTNNKLANNLAIQEQTVKANVDLSIENMKKNDLNSSGFAPLNNLMNTVGQMFEDPNVGQLIAQNSTIQNELGSLLAVKNASGTTVFDKMASAGIINRNDTQEVITQKVNALISEAANFATSLKSANAEAYKQTDPFLQDPNNPLRAQYKAQKQNSSAPANIESVKSKYNISY